MFTGLYTSNPNTDPNAKRIEVVENINELDVDVGGAGSSVGTGGMVTKLTAARIACAAGCKTIVCLSSNLEKDVEACVLRGESVGTAFLPAKIAAKGKKKWILAVPIHGTIKVDRAGANAVIRGLPLLTTHVTECDGSFRVQECVRIVNEDGQEIARGLCNYNSLVLSESAKDYGCSAPMGTVEGDQLDGWVDDEDGPPECVHANNVCVTHVETLKKSFTFNDFLGAGYDSNDSRGASPGPSMSPRQSDEDRE